MVYVSALLIALVPVFLLQTNTNAFLLDTLDPCSEFKQYAYQLNITLACHSLGEVAIHMSDLYIKAVRKLQYIDSCINPVLDSIAEFYKGQTTIPSFCHCSGSVSTMTFHSDELPDHRECWQNNQRYQAAYQAFFGSHASQVGCSTHHSLWPLLKGIGFYYYTNCQANMLAHIAAAFKHNHQNCACSVGSAPQLAPVTTGDDCTRYSSYKTLMSWGTSSACESANQVWHHLNDLMQHTSGCRTKIINFLSEKYGRQGNIPDGCTCTGSPHRRQFEMLKDLSGHYSTCHSDPGYNALERKLYTRVHGCHTQHFVWHQLHIIHQVQNQDCQRDFIRHADLTDDENHDPCSCAEASQSTVIPTTTVPTTTVSTTTTTKTTTTTTSPTTTQNITQVASLYTCDKLSLITAISINLTVSENTSSSCNLGGQSGSNEDLVLHFCVLGNIASWQCGVQVTSHCDDIPLYTPIATFKDSGYVYSTEVQSGIFIGCLGDGFRVAVERCNGPPTIIHIDGTGSSQTLASNPKNYYTIA